MRTTISMDDSLLVRAKQAAAQQHRSLASLVEEALRNFLSTSLPARKRLRHIELPESGKGGVLPGIDLSNSDDLLLAMEKADDSYGR